MKNQAMGLVAGVWHMNVKAGMVTMNSTSGYWRAFFGPSFASTSIFPMATVVGTPITKRAVAK